MSGNADMGVVEEYSPLSSFSIINLSLVHTVIEEQKGEIISVCLDMKNQIIQCHSMIHTCKAIDL